MHYVDDAIGTCAFLSSFRGQFGGKPPYHIYNLPRALNIRRGLRRSDEKPPEDHWKKRDPEMETRMLDAYYEFKGWNNDGIPTKETLDALDLGYVSEDFLKRGILTE